MKNFLLKLGVVDKNSFWALVKQFIKFGIVGCSNALIYFTIYYTLLYFDIYYILSGIIAFWMSVLNAYYWNSKHVFIKNNRSHVRQVAKVYVSYGFTFLLSTVLLYAMVDILEISKYIAPICNACITAPINFLLNKFWAFK